MQFLSVALTLAEVAVDHEDEGQTKLFPPIEISPPRYRQKGEVKICKKSPQYRTIK